MRTGSVFSLAAGLLLAVLSAGQAAAQKGEEAYPVIPRPASLHPLAGSFTIKPSTRLLIHSTGGEVKELQDFIRDFLAVPLGAKLKKGSTAGAGEDGAINILVDDSYSIPAEGYELNVTAERIVLKASTAAGAFWGFQTLRQLLPPQAEKAGGAGGRPSLQVPCVEISDAPRFSYRGLHLDVGRHIFPAEFIKKYIDLMVLYKFNTFHWHLTEDQGWRIEIKKYPRLQEVAAYRKETLEGHKRDRPARFDGQRYGGYYTQKEVKEIVEYARLRHVTVIPEIEMPGHSLAALAAYPELGCTGGPYETGTTWGVFEDIYCAGNEKTFRFLEDVLTEVMALFPSKYIHIGGDEAPKARWEKCPKCQARIRTEGLKDEHELQSYFIGRIERFLNAHGRSIIGWDEILEGGLAPNATVMSWRGIKGGIAAARQGHDVVMTPSSHLYFDHYQSRAAGEPLAIGGFTPLEKVYGYEPVPQELNEQEARHILGAQANLWTEYIETSAQAEYMAYPRALALAEVVWSPSGRRDYEDFLGRLKPHFQRLSALGARYSTHVFDVQAKAEAASAGLKVTLWSADPTAVIHYTLDGSAPSAASRQYNGPLALEQSATLKAIRVTDGQPAGAVLEQAYLVHKAVGRNISLETPPDPSRGEGGASALVDGQRGNGQAGAQWIGWKGKDLEAVIDLEEPQLVKGISLRFGNDRARGVCAPRTVEVLFSYDGYAFTPFYETDEVSAEGETVELEIPVGEENIRYIKVIARNYGEIPADRPGEGNPAWLLTDEIVVE